MNKNNQPKGMVAAGHEETAAAAAEILKAGGNAFDAAIAGFAAACVCEPILASLGGGGFMMAAKPNEDPQLYDFFCQTPSLSVSDQSEFFPISVDFGTAKQEFHIGAASTAVPGCLPGIRKIHQDLCSLPLADLFAPAIKLAREGVVLTKFQAYVFDIVTPILSHETKQISPYRPNSETLKKGDCFYNHQLADVFDDLSKPENFDVFSRQHFVLDNGLISFSDIENYEVIVRKPIEFDRDGYDSVYLNPSPSIGGSLIDVGLTYLNEFSDSLQPLSNLYEAIQAANTRRPVIERHQGIQNEASKGTTHISVVDSEGNAASLTVSNGEGNGNIVPGTGIMLNNMLGEEDLNTGGFHSYQAGSRLSSIMAPTISRSMNGDITVLGSGGSNRIWTAILQVLYYQLLGCNYTLEKAINRSRVHVEKCGTVSFENGSAGDNFTQKDIAELARRVEKDGRKLHRWDEQNMFFGGVHAVCRKADGQMSGFGDTRRAGVAKRVD